MRNSSGILYSWKYIFRRITQNATPVHKNLYSNISIMMAFNRRSSFQLGYSSGSPNLTGS
jgi:hypothetical protein